jgi:hypothetical protein
VEAAPGRWGIEPDHPNAAIAAETTLVARVLDRQREDILRWFASRADEMPEWLDAATLTGSYIWLTSDEAVELTDAIQGRIDWFRGRSDLKIRPDGAGRV